ncbi:ribosomal protection-like ABC-F family protein [Gorillibacterium sp. sgz500922]|uniref:ribosomal protection-like ABC-F family protein n=1 Tax=Gorillibacterium sp. sgz500922 TaxID=3446694 RepID=UPI003F66FA73
MIVASLNEVTVYNGAQEIFRQVGLELHEGDRVGLVGPNGSGKSTLLRLLAGTEAPHEGSIALRKGLRVSYLAQNQAEWAGDAATLYDRLAFGLAEMRELGGKLAEAEARMADPAWTEDADRLAKLLDRYAEWQEAFERGGGYGMDARIRQVAAGLGFAEDRFGAPYAGLSGGEKTKAGLAAALIERPELLLLDEPTNHLDLAGVEWLESYLSEYPGTCLIVSHDRYFLDRVVTRIVELEDGSASLYPTSYSGYVREKEERLLREFAEYQEQQKQIRKMKESIRQLQEWGGLGGDKRFFTRAASLQKALDRMEKRKRPVLERRTASFDLAIGERSGRKALVLEDVRKRFGEREVLRGAAGELEFGETIAIVGENGSGKTTLFKLVLGELQPDGGRLALGAQAKVGYLAQEAVPPDRKETVLDCFRKEAGLEEGEARGRLARYLFCGQEVFKPVAALSGGEWTRLRLALLVERKPNLLLLDEPTNHLDIASREALEETLEDYPGSVLLISHDRYLINKLAGKIWELKDGRLTLYYGSYEEYRAKAGRSPALPGDPEARGGKKAADGGKEQPPNRSSSPPKSAPASAARRAEELEAEIASREERLARLEAELADPDLAADGDRLSGLWEEQEALRLRLEQTYEEWLALTSKEEPPRP